ncbi:helix-turn-helix transcriptional regulator [Micromonospora orduensis]|uniref:Helix-turn-helix transcriptional regulator n=1 Tax=Micromonospora orduensis TaxID=1420891 RepID=A0A5C4Q8A9_9ACTN|nr:helix-turn-helix domain-containing protein [Micromonospora orduensis]TNH21470.1 helix-turn-helix transcriptional regulator [Micromonospora orduensis]
MESPPPDGRTEPSRVDLNARQVRVLAHPLRMRLLGSLRIDGPATATALAEKLGTNTGATSYHLRQLAEVGLVAEDPDRGAGRQRWWQAAHDMSHFDPTDFDDDPDARAAVQWIRTNQVRLMGELAERWMAVEHTQSRAWRDAAGMSDLVLPLDPARLLALNDDLWAVLMRYRDDAVADAPDVKPVHVFLAGFPRLEERW